MLDIYHEFRGTPLESRYLFVPKIIASASHHAKIQQANAQFKHIQIIPRVDLDSSAVESLLLKFMPMPRQSAIQGRQHERRHMIN